MELPSTRTVSRGLRRSRQMPHTVAYVHCKQCENCNSNKEIVKWYSFDVVRVWGAWNVRSGLILLGLTVQIRGPLDGVPVVSGLL